jgi:chemotaxis protein methyltransferase CheR
MHRFQTNQFDFIFLRNVLIYFSDTDQQRIVSNVLQTLKPGGIVYFGHSEQMAARNSNLEKVGVGAWRKSTSNKKDDVTSIHCRWPKNSVSSALNK